jgi:hypothetical protein
VLQAHYFLTSLRRPHLAKTTAGALEAPGRARAKPHEAHAINLRTQNNKHTGGHGPGAAQLKWRPATGSGALTSNGSRCWLAPLADDELALELEPGRASRPRPIIDSNRHFSSAQARPPGSDHCEVRPLAEVRHFRAGFRMQISLAFAGAAPVLVVGQPTGSAAPAAADR